MKTILKSNYETILFFCFIILFIFLATIRVNELNNNSKYNISEYKIIVNR